jgi:chorismate synthase
MKSKIVGCFQYSSISELRERIEQANNMDIDIIEIRLDYLPPAKPNQQLIQEIKEISKKPIILTIRDINEGGANEYALDKRLQLVLWAIELKYDYIDLELANWADFSPKINSNNSNISTTKIILSWHGKIDLGANQIEQKLEKMKFFNPAISKIVVECETASFASTFESELLKIWQNNPKRSLSVFGIKKFGLQSRILGYSMGNQLTYVALQKNYETAPGQISLSQFYTQVRIAQSMTLGSCFSVQTFGESHGFEIGCIITGFPANIKLNLDLIKYMLHLRRPGQYDISSSRSERDDFNITNGIENGETTGAPLRFTIPNIDIKSQDYTIFNEVPRPSHIDYPAQLRFGSEFQIQGGGIFSGRLTAPFVIAGSLALQQLSKQEICIKAYTSQIGPIIDEKSYSCEEIMKIRDNNPVRSSNADLAQEMIKIIQEVKQDNDSIGGKISVVIENIPAGVGDPWFHSLESRLAQAILGIPGVRGIEFGTGFQASFMKGSEHNDPYILEDGKISTVSNHCGGIIGGIAIGNPISLHIAVKPTASIGKGQKTLNFASHKQVELKIQGRHDPCIVPRIIPVVESITAIILYDQMKLQKIIS